MVDAVLKDLPKAWNGVVVMDHLPKAWNGVVVMDWSNGFWDKMKIKHNNLVII
jgi:hypothetical protein